MTDYTTEQDWKSKSEANKVTIAEELIHEGTRRLDVGWPVIPCNGKVPCDDRGFALNDWQNLPHTVERLQDGVRGAQQPALGLIMGPRSDTIDVESDSPGELKAAQHLFRGCNPDPTVSYRSKRGRHDWYKYDSRLEPIKKATFEYKSPDGNSVKIRLGLGSKASQSIIPPSPDREWLPGHSPDDCNVQPLPEIVIERLLEAAAGPPLVTAPDATAASETGAHQGGLRAMLAATKNMEDGGDGSKRLLTAACRAVEHNLSDQQAIDTIRAYEAEKPFPSVWSDAEILTRVRDAETKVARGVAVVIRNYDETEVKVHKENGDEDEKATETIILPKPMSEIIEDIRRHRGDWPRRADNTLFIDDEHGLSWFDKSQTSGLFGWLQRHHRVDWKGGGRFVKQAELFAEIGRTAHSYEAIELFPHEPPIDGTYYRGKAPPPGDGSHLRWLLDRFRPETTIDRDLIQAAFMTQFWGGPAGCRPCFVVTSDDGRGVGKSTVAQIGGELCGGLIDVSAGEDIATLKTRMLTPSARTQRIALVDNIKTMKLSWAELESLITSTVISGRQLYVGEGQRPNVLTWYLTLNGVSLATDMAQRSVIIKVVRGENSGTWLEETRAYVREHREQIIGDIIGALRAETYPLAEFSRWATWEQHVLTRLPEPGEAQRVILERQDKANCELDEAEIIEGYFAGQLSRLEYCPQTAQVRIPVAVVARWYGWATNEKAKTAAVSKHLHQMAGEGQLKRISPDSSRSHGRCFIWTGAKADVIGEPISNDLQGRLDRTRADS